MAAHSIDGDAAKQAVDAGLRRLAAAPPAARATVAAEVFAPGCRFHVAHPFNDFAGLSEALAGFFDPLLASLDHAGRTHAIVATDLFEGARLVAVMGHYHGTLTRDLVGIPAHHKPVWIRFGEIHRIEDGRIAESWMLPDMLDLIRQVGLWPLAPSLGAEHQWPTPGGNARALSPTDHDAGHANLALVRAMHAALGTFDGKSLESMDLAPYWTEDFAWYGPAGIGTAFGLDGFRSVHQIPFLTAFPDRQGGQHIGRIGDGEFVVTGGWPSVTATHTGNGFCGMPATGRRVGMRVMDFYRCEGGLIAENWVPLDITHLLLQMGYDIFARLAHLGGNPRTSL
ncbi:ester cyclase [Erythrobacter sp. NE805]|uniref:ester cyclase n=1 Tax=Erythrobacter sp. NE805 TaxID=3389875 RepID=UPI00396B3700